MPIGAIWSSGERAAAVMTSARRCHVRSPTKRSILNASIVLNDLNVDQAEFVTVKIESVDGGSIV